MFQTREFIKVQNLTNESTLLDFDSWTSIFAIPILLTSFLVSISSRLALVNFVLRIAPSRPINLNILVDQVRLSIITKRFMYQFNYSGRSNTVVRLRLLCGFDIMDLRKIGGGYHRTFR